MGDLRMTFDDRGTIRRLQGADLVFADEMATAVLRTSIEGANASKGIVRDRGRIDVGQLINSLAVEPVRRVAGAVRGGWGTNVRHGRVNEQGRRAGARMPPPDVLLPWMARHGIPKEAEFPLRRAIAERGIPGIWFMRDGLAKTRPIFRREMDAAVSRALRRIGGGR